MAIERLPGEQSLLDVVERVLEKGIVIEASDEVSLVDDHIVQARVSIASITRQKYEDAVGQMSRVTRPGPEGGDDGGGSSGAPAMLDAALEPRRRRPSRPDRTRRQE